jgi:hypothetical protein
MDPVNNVRATAQELVSFAQQQGIDLKSLCVEGNFEKDQRWILLWRKDERPYSGPAGEKEGTLHYNMQGAISALPRSLKESAGAFHGVWSEAGTFEDVKQAFELVKAWLLDRKEVDDLPSRSVRRYSI